MKKIRFVPVLVLTLAAALPLSGCKKAEPRETASFEKTKSGVAKPAKDATAKEKKGPPKQESTHALGLRVKLELLQKLGTDGLRVRVAAEDSGEVRLAGVVKKRATAELAEEVARQVDGVKSVSNKIRLASEDGGDKVDALVAETEAELSDAALETRVRLALVDKMGTDGFRIGTDAASGVLTLEFPKKMEKDRRREASEIAKKVEGVSRIVALDKG